MQTQMNMESQTKWAIAAIVALALVGIFSPLAFADDIGAPTSAAGGLSAPSSPSLSGAAGPLGDSGSFGRGLSDANALDSRADSVRPLSLQPGTGKFEGPQNGTTTPCIGSTGFGSSSTLPGHAC